MTPFATTCVNRLLRCAGADRRRPLPHDFVRSSAWINPLSRWIRFSRSILERAVVSAGYPVHRMPSGAGHDAMILARRMPAAMLFLRSPGGISHHPDESVLAADVDAALDVGNAVPRRTGAAPCLIWWCAEARSSSPAIAAGRHRDRRRQNRRDRPRSFPARREEIDARGLHVFPGLIDVHLHFNEPGRTDWEGAATGSRALAAGGGTLFFDMPLNSTPCTVNAAAFDRKRAALAKSSITDFALWGGLIPGNVPEMAELADRGVVGFKAFLCDSGLPEFPRADDLTLFEGMREAARLGLPVAVHAESQELTQGSRANRGAGPQQRSRFSGIAAR